MSCQPSPSWSRKAHPEPSVSGRNFPPNAPLWCRKAIPAEFVTSLRRKERGGSAAHSERGEKTVVAAIPDIPRKNERRFTEYLPAHCGSRTPPTPQFCEC